LHGEFGVVPLVGPAFLDRGLAQNGSSLLESRGILGSVDGSRQEVLVERERIKALLERLRAGELTVDEALDDLRLVPLTHLGFATVDLHRAMRCGFPEVIFGAGKTTEEIVEIARQLRHAGQAVLVTRTDREVHQALVKLDSAAEYHPLARAVTIRDPKSGEGRPGVTVLTGGTSDRSVAEEAIVTAEIMGHEVRKIFDVGVAGLHRLLEHREALIQSRVIVAVAGMEGALASVVTGLTDCPVIGVPTSTGYGAGPKGEAALLAMLNSCAAGLTVVNIDNGFGAGYAAALINRNREKSPQKQPQQPHPESSPQFLDFL
jgi:NCAIR mutase (PurE)-related protein